MREERERAGSHSVGGQIDAHQQVKAVRVVGPHCCGHRDRRTLVLRWQWSPRRGDGIGRRRAINVLGSRRHWRWQDGLLGHAACADAHSCTIDTCYEGKCIHTIGPNLGATACPPLHYCDLEDGCV
jgi:hypothetical protein